MNRNLEVDVGELGEGMVVDVVGKAEALFRRVHLSPDLHQVTVGVGGVPVWGSRETMRIRTHRKCKCALFAVSVKVLDDISKAEVGGNSVSFSQPPL